MAMPPHDQDNPSSKSSNSEQPYRDAKVIRGSDGTQWFAHEVGGDALGAGQSCLLLVSTQQVRRIMPVPLHWRALDPDSLLALSYSRL